MPSGNRCSRCALSTRTPATCATRQGVVDPPRSLLAGVPGLELVEIERPDMCCGSAGTYNLLEPRAARELGERKAQSILAAEPDVVATANPGCALQLAAAFRRSGRPDLAVLHPVELVARSLYSST